MKNKPRQYGQGRPGRAISANTISQQQVLMDGVVDIGRAVDCSFVTRFLGRPYPVQFRAQGALDAWTRALGKTALWRGWQDPGTLWQQLRQDLHKQLECGEHMSPESGQMMAEDRQRLADEVSTNLKYYLSQGTVIEATPALETLLTNSDVDLSLPMNMVVPPYRAQYLRFGEAAMHFLKVPAPWVSDRVFDGVFCFLTQHAMSGSPAPKRWKLELVFISKHQDSYGGHVSLLGETDRGDVTVGEWLNQILNGATKTAGEDIHRSMHAAVSYVVRVFLYMALKQARVIPHQEYDEALRRAAGLGERKRAKLLQRSASLYNGILVGPESLPPGASEGVAGGFVAPHWRRGHVRLQPFGAGNQQRKLIFVAPALIHAEQLQGDVPPPKSYRAGSAATPRREHDHLENR